jgi:uncharacterized membrane protein YhaH (DUF805 family)
MNKAVPYNNNIFSLKGRLSRAAYITQNLIINIVGFRFLYYPQIVEAYYKMKINPEYKYLIEQLGEAPHFAYAFKALDQAPKETMLVIIIKYLFIIPFRMIDIKRVKDIVDRELTSAEIWLIAIIFTLPYVDFFTTLGLSLIPAFYYASKNKHKDIKATDLNEARNENFLQLNQKLFESGKISRADYIKARDEHTKKH